MVDLSFLGTFTWKPKRAFKLISNCFDIEQIVKCRFIIK